MCARTRLPEAWTCDGCGTARHRMWFTRMTLLCHADREQVDHVILFDFPLNSTEYLHRVGRTARGGGRGVATSLVTKRDRVLAGAMEVCARLLGEPGAQSVSRPPVSHSHSVRYWTALRLRSCRRTARRTCAKEAGVGTAGPVRGATVVRQQ